MLETLAEKEALLKKQEEELKNATNQPDIETNSLIGQIQAQNASSSSQQPEQAKNIDSPNTGAPETQNQEEIDMQELQYVMEQKQKLAEDQDKVKQEFERIEKAKKLLDKQKKEVARLTELKIQREIQKKLEAAEKLELEQETEMKQNQAEEAGKSKGLGWGTKFVNKMKVINKNIKEKLAQNTEEDP